MAGEGDKQKKKCTAQTRIGENKLQEGQTKSATLGHVKGHNSCHRMCGKEEWKGSMQGKTWHMDGQHQDMD